MADVTELLATAHKGDPEALSKLLPMVYGELHRLAGRYMRRERRAHTMQTTALVHEAYLRLMRQEDLSFTNRAHFMAIAANLMRQILVERARARQAMKRGGAGIRITYDESLAAAAEPPVDLLALDQALTRLQSLDPGRARIVELRFFGGLTVEETAEAMDISPATVKRQWSVARAWLYREISRGADRGP
jgi:RNA polymerase sigma-70 factor (ECF subfamily)